MSNVIYPIKRKLIVVHSLPTGQASFNLDNIFMGNLPEQLIIGLVSHDAYNGSFTLNPLAFKNYGLNHLCVYLNGEQYPKVSYTPDYQNDNYEREFYDFHNEQGLTDGIGIMDMTYISYKAMTALYCFNFNADFSSSGKEYINLAKEGTLRIEIGFDTALTTALKLICFGRFDNNIEIDRNRNVITDY